MSYFQLNSFSETNLESFFKSNKFICFYKSSTFYALVQFCIIAFCLPITLHAIPSKIDSVLKVIESTQIDTVKVNALHQLAYEICDTMPNEALAYAKEALSISEKIKFETGFAKCNNVMGIIYGNIGKFDSAKYYLQRPLKTIIKLNDERLLAQTYYHLSVFCNNLGESDTVDYYLNIAEEQYSKLKDKKGIAKIWTLKGRRLHDQIKNKEAIELYFKALKVFESLNEKAEIAQILHKISQLYFSLKQNDKSEQFAKKCFDLSEENHDYTGMVSGLYTLSRIYRRQQKFEKSIECLLQAKVIALKLNDMYRLTHLNTGLALNYRELKKFDIALQYFDSALFSSHIVKDKDLTASIYEGMSGVLSDQGNYKNALEYLRKYEVLIKEIKAPDRLKNTYYNYAHVFTYLNQPDSVSKYFDKYEQISDSLYNEQTSNAIAEMQTKYETEKKDNEILGLKLEAQKKKNAIWAVSSLSVLVLMVLISGFLVYKNRKKREHAVLLQTIAETNIKALRAQMNPHFIFNCIHTIDSLLDDQKIQESKDCLLKFATLTRSVLENSNKREIPLADELNVLIVYMDLENTRQTNPFIYLIETDEGLNTEVTLIPPLILQPFVENAIKHGFEGINRAGQLKIGIKKENDLLVCTIEDNGCGRNRGKVNRAGSAFKKESMGIKLTEERLRLLAEVKNTQTSFTIEDLRNQNNKPSGTRINIHLPFEQSI
jgi:tetratricopeptide (TPR) repeat protein